MTGKEYELVVRGTVSPTLLAMIQGLQVARCENGMTYLIGWASDQCLIHSVLDVLWDLNIELVSINPVASSTHNNTVAVP